LKNLSFYVLSFTVYMKHCVKLACIQYGVKRLGGGNTYIFYIFLLSVHFTRFFVHFSLSSSSKICTKFLLLVHVMRPNSGRKCITSHGTKLLRVFLLAIHSRTGPPGWRATTTTLFKRRLYPLSQGLRIWLLSSKLITQQHSIEVISGP
jgi:hypothetical protein